MTANTSDDMPALPDKLNVGDPVIVHPVPSRYRRKQFIPATITKAGRVWVEMHGPDGGVERTWRMRIDTQNEGNVNYPQHNSYFYTPEQHAWKERLREADEFLRDQGITVGRVGNGAPWVSPPRRILLARLIREVSE